MILHGNNNAESEVLALRFVRGKIERLSNGKLGSDKSSDIMDVVAGSARH